MENREENTMTNNRENNYEITENVQLLVDNSALKSECVKINCSSYEGKPCSRFLVSHNCPEDFGCLRP